MKVKKYISIKSYKFDSYERFYKRYLRFVEYVIALNEDVDLEAEIVKDEYTIYINNINELKSFFETNSKFFWIKLKISGNKANIEFDLHTFENVRMKTKLCVVCESKEIVKNIEEEFVLLFAEFEKFSIRKIRLAIASLVAILMFFGSSIVLVENFLFTDPNLVIKNHTSKVVLSYIIALVSFGITALTIKMIAPKFRIPQDIPIRQKVIEVYRKNKLEKSIGIFEAIVIGFVMLFIGKIL